MAGAKYMEDNMVRDEIEKYHVGLLGKSYKGFEWVS